MTLRITGKVLNNNNESIPYFKTELWESDKQNNLIRTVPISTSSTNAYGNFSLRAHEAVPSTLTLVTASFPLGLFRRKAQPYFTFEFGVNDDRTRNHS